jgi:hypothetical protein
LTFIVEGEFFNARATIGICRDRVLRRSELRRGDVPASARFAFATNPKESSMKTLSTWTLSLVLAMSLTTAAFAAQPRTYQVTGPVLEVRDDVIVVQKGKEKWEIARSPDTKVTGDLKVGSKVTIEYRMSAATVEVKADKAPAAKPEKAAATK